MARLDVLRSQLPEVKVLQMQADGHAMWVTWTGALNAVVLQTLEDYGGVKMAEGADQALWFFFTPDIFLAAARLESWARFNQLALIMQIFPVRFKVGRLGEQALIFDESLWQQEISSPEDFQVWIHPSASGLAGGMPGINLEAKQPYLGMSSIDWLAMTADSRLPYQSSFGWFALLHPVGNPLDKTFQAGWRDFFGHIETVLQRNKFRFTVHNFFLMFPLDGMRQLKSWCRDFLSLVNRIKEEKPEHYWPCVLTVIDRKGMPFNEDLPKKTGVDWDQLAPDHPCLSMRNALMLGDEFTFHEVRFAKIRHNPDDWTTITLKGDDDETRGSLPHLVPGTLVLGENAPCFYCGHRGHTPDKCPTRTMELFDLSLWRQVALLDSSDMVHAVQQIDKTLTEADDVGFRQLLTDPAPTGLMLRAFYDINWIGQLRNATFFWRARDKDFRKALATVTVEDNSLIWPALHEFCLNPSEDAEKELYTLSIRFPKDSRITSLRGFVALESGDIAKAAAFWKDAEMFSTQPVAQAWHVYLQARAAEIQGKLPLAISTYEHVYRLCPSWTTVEYRRLVCAVKSGFAEQAMPAFLALMERDSNYFNRMLIDPELERGHLQILRVMHQLWTSTASTAKEETTRLERMKDELASWFLPDNPYSTQASERIQKLLQLSTISNYVTFQALLRGRGQIEKDLQTHVHNESRNFKAQFKALTARLQKIQEEAAWFPFPRALVEFNKSYSQCAANMTWASGANFNLPEPFRKAQELIHKEKDRITQLEKRMRFLRIVRDSTLFVLSMLESFFWIELAGVILIFALLPLILMYGDKAGLGATVKLLSTQRWPIQKALFFVISVVALGSAGLRTVLSFESIRDKILAKAKEAAMKQSSARREAQQQLQQQRAARKKEAAK